VNGHPLSLAVDLVGNRIYWSESDTGLIRRANLDGSNAQTIGSTGYPGDSHAQHIAVDFGGGKVYWAEWCEDGPTRPCEPRLMRANLDGSAPEAIWIGLGYFLVGVALDTEAGKVYWTTQSTGIAPDVIFRANLNGSNVQQVLALAEGTEPRAIALDHEQQKIYWAQLGAIRRADLNGANAETVIGPPHGTSDGLAVDSIEQKIYWTEGGGEVYRANLDGSGIESLFDVDHPDEAVGLFLDVRGVPIPAASTWSLTVLSILLMIGGTITFGRSTLTASLARAA
jgi:DNA-binding beta-propeller fold protein YncE